VSESRNDVLLPYKCPDLDIIYSAQSIAPPPIRTPRRLLHDGRREGILLVRDEDQRWCRRPAVRREVAVAGHPVLHPAPATCAVGLQVGRERSDRTLTRLSHSAFVSESGSGIASAR